MINLKNHFVGHGNSFLYCQTLYKVSISSFYHWIIYSTVTPKMSSSDRDLGYELDWNNGKTFVFLYKTHKRSLLFFFLPLGTSFQEFSQDHNSKKEAFFLMLRTISEEGGIIVFLRVGGAAALRPMEMAGSHWRMLWAMK